MMKINVGLCRKIGEANYGSRGATVNLELELDSSLVGEPAKLKERIRQLFALVRTSLAEELNGGNSNGHCQQPNGGAQPPNSQNGNGNGNGHSPGAQNGLRSGGQRPATQSQVKAIYAIARGRQINVAQFLRERFQVGRPDDLSLKDASAVIDELKSPDGSGE
jgi:hypothetical protein